jgi:hypothetical protein
VLLPSKAIAADQALITVAGQVLIQLERPRSISAAWDDLRHWRTARGMPSAVPFWWFSLAVDVLYATGAIELADGTLRRTSA